MGDYGASVCIYDSMTGPCTVWLRPEAAKLIGVLPRLKGRGRMFRDGLTSNPLYTFWVGVREEAGLPGFRIHDCRHS